MTGGEWIPMEERTPLLGGEYLVHGVGGTWVGWWDADEREWFVHEGIVHPRVTHWRPLPEAPG